MNTTKHYTTAEVHEKLRQAIGQSTQKEFAAKLGISEAYVSDLLRQRRDLPDWLLNVLGLQWGIIDQERSAHGR